MYVESRKNLIYNEYFEELTNVLKDSEELLAYTQYEWYFFCCCFVFKPLLQDFKRIRCCRLQEIFLSCRASLGSLHEERLSHLFQLFIHYPPEEIPPPPSLGTHTQMRGRLTGRAPRRRFPTPTQRCAGGRIGFPRGVWDLHRVLLPTGERAGPRPCYPVFIVCTASLHVPSVSERRIPSATKFRTGVLSKSHGIPGVYAQRVAISSQEGTVSGSVQDSSSLLHWAMHLSAYTPSHT